MSELSGDEFGTLSAYHDGELHGLARWRFERRLRRSAALRRELAALGGLGSLVRETELRADAPDLWDRIELRLPAVDARRGEADASPRSTPAGWWRPLGAVAVAAVALVAIVYTGLFDATPLPQGAVRWMDSGGHSVLVDDAESDVTIIWLLDDAVEGAARGGTGEVV